jgi:hypothetical protein
MKKLLFTLLFVPFLVSGQNGPPPGVYQPPSWYAPIGTGGTVNNYYTNYYTNSYYYTNNITTYVTNNFTNYVTNSFTFTRKMVTYTSGTINVTNVDYKMNASGNVTLGAFVPGADPAQLYWATVTIYNTASTNITTKVGSSSTLWGASTTDPTTVPVGKQVLYSIWINGSGSTTNVITGLQQ